MEEDLKPVSANISSLGNVNWCNKSNKRAGIFSIRLIFATTGIDPLHLHKGEACFSDCITSPHQLLLIFNRPVWNCKTFVLKVKADLDPEFGELWHKVLKRLSGGRRQFRGQHYPRIGPWCLCQGVREHEDPRVSQQHRGVSCQRV